MNNEPADIVTCDACGGLGFLLVHTCGENYRIERCDACERFSSDEEAIIHVFQAAGGEL